MGLSAGLRLGPYQIESPLGAGGMGEVYRARDMRLERTVAIKVLNSALIATPDVRARFEREAKAISQLNHPNICVLHDIGNANGTEFLVMEYLEGETLSERLKKGALPLDQVVKIGCEIAKALARAHHAGIVHRDLKPGNVMLTKSGAKLLDFGLAKPAAAGAGHSGSAPLSTTVMTMTSPIPQHSPVTQQGVLVGTVQYMSPEQIQGAEADARSDIFALGAMLYEMTTGKRPFEGKSQLGVASAIVEKDPEPIRTMAPTIPAELEHLITQMLAKDPEQRWQCAGDVRRVLEMRTLPPATWDLGAASPAWKRVLPWAIAAAMALVAAWGWVLLSKKVQPRRITASLEAPRDMSFDITGDRAGPPTISPDGTNIVYGAGGRLWLQQLDQEKPRLLDGTEGATFPFWSPDGKSLGLFLAGKLQTMLVTGGAPVTVCDAPNARGGTWSQAGFILFAPSLRSPIMKVPEGGGTPEPVTAIKEGIATTHRFPQMLPDGTHFLFFSANHANPYGDAGAEYVGSVDGGEPVRLVHVLHSAVYAAGRLLYLRGFSLTAQKMDLESLRLTGEPAVIASDVGYDGGTFHGLFTASDSGLLIFRNGGLADGRLQWYSPTGQADQVVEPSSISGLALSPDETRLLEITDPEGELRLAAVNGSNRTKLAAENPNGAPVWSPDGSRFAFSHLAGAGLRQLMVQASDGTGSATALYKEAVSQSPTDWSQDGKYILYERGEPGNANIWVMPTDGVSKPFAVVRSTSTWVRDGRFSPDGKWVAFAMRGTIGDEVYITPFPGPGTNWLVSHAGGHGPRWSADGKWLYFWKANNTDLVKIAVDTGTGAPTIGQKEQLLLKTLVLTTTFYDPVYAMDRHGRALISTIGASNTLTLVSNWTSGVK
jgi:Tol biopolymer transport system component